MRIIGISNGFVACTALGCSLSCLLAAVASAQPPGPTRTDRTMLSHEVKTETDATAYTAAPEPGKGSGYYRFMKEADSLSTTLEDLRLAQQAGATPDEERALLGDAQLTAMRMIKLLPEVEADVSPELLDSVRAPLATEPPGATGALP